MKHILLISIILISTSCISHLKEKIAVTGIAENTNGKAEIFTDYGQLYQIENIDLWADEVNGKRLIISGTKQNDSILQNITFKLDSIQDGSKVNIVGTALNFFEGARIYYGDIKTLEFYQLEGIDYWNDSVCNKEVLVSGTVKFEKIIPYKKDPNTDMIHHYYQDRFIMKKLYDVSYKLKED
jgi:hypothetical protein